jgi:hypothetical protein
MAKVLFADYDFADIELERSLFDAAGVESGSLGLLPTLQRLPLVPQKSLVELTDLLQRFFQPMIVVDPCPCLRHLLGPQAHLAGSPTRVDHIQHPQRMSLTPIALRTAAVVPDGAFKQRAAKNQRQVWEAAEQFVASSGGVPFFHLYR